MQPSVHPTWGSSFMSVLVLATMNLNTKFEGYSFSHFKVMKGLQN